jgi:diadenosine tetraphosphatase ApaH/serine/threonine PP2A family protein phosphatase
VSRLGEERGGVLWEGVCQAFDALPLAAVVASKFLVLHGGVGRRVSGGR